jgi:cysteinyl-tRNA synthetase
MAFREAMFKKAMDNDLNTPQALAELQELRGEINRQLLEGLPGGKKREVHNEFRKLGKVLGLFQLEPNQWQFNPPVRGTVGIVTEMDEARPIAQIGELTPEKIEAKIAERAEAKKQKDFKRADVIRAELASLGITLEDKPDGTSRWKR